MSLSNRNNNGSYASESNFAYHVDLTTPYWQDGICSALPTSFYTQGVNISSDSPDFIDFDHLSSALASMQETGSISDPSPSPDQDNWPAFLIPPVDLANESHIQSPYIPVMTSIAAQNLTPRLQHERQVAGNPPNRPARKRRQVNKQNPNLTE